MGDLELVALANLPKYDERDVRYLVRAFGVSEKSECLRKKVGVYLVIPAGRAHETYIVEAVNQPPQNKPTCKQRGECLMRERNGRMSCVNTIHAEVVAVVEAGRQKLDLRGSTMYVTCKPCLDCAKVLALAGVKRVVFYETNEIIEPQFAQLVDALELVQVAIEDVPQDIKDKYRI